MSLPAFVEHVGGGIHAVDTGFQRPRFDAAYLLVHDGRAAFIDTGTNHAVPRLLAALDALGLGRDAVDFVIPTHVHLDHAGGVGLLMQSLPRARLVVHPRGARHLIDPRALYHGALAVYGREEMERSYGTLVGVDAARVHETHDGEVMGVGGRSLAIAHTPGHAKHHHCVWDAETAGWFCGDTFGLSYREFDDAAGRAWVLPSTTPVQFEPQALRASIDRLLEREPRCMYVTHYGRVDGVPALARELLTQLDAMVAIGERLRDAPQRHDALRRALSALYLERVRRHGSPREDAEVAALLEMDIELNAQGMAAWLDR